MLFQAPSSFFDPSFWEELYKRKLHVYKLQSTALPLLCSSKCSNGKNGESFEFSKLSFSENLSGNNELFCGSLINVNTVEEFRDMDKKGLLEDSGRNIFGLILNGDAVRNPSVLLQFALLTFADLKSYKFTYWLGVPALVPDKAYISSELVALKDRDSQLTFAIYKSMKDSLTTSNLPYIFAIYHPTSTTSEELPFVVDQLLTLEQAWPYCFHPAVYFVVPDSSSADNSVGWTVRNFLALLAISAGVTRGTSEGLVETARVIGLRGAIAKRMTAVSGGAQRYSDTGLAELVQVLSVEDIVDGDCSVFAEVQIDPTAFATALGHYSFENDSDHVMGRRAVLRAECSVDAVPLKVVGWESNERGKPGPRVADLSNTLDGRYLMAQAVDLNLSLMKWRMWPELDTQKLAGTRCLLLGAGTLGCAVARSLLGWGVRNITLVDSGRVSYSNPARQCLFEYEDCVNKRFKAEAAAERLRRIFPDVNANGVVLSIPMPGHPLPAYADHEESDDSLQHEEDRDYYALRELVLQSDVVFALTDSREARWLPTAMCAAENKILINAALGFDSYLVMRHGHGLDAQQQRGEGDAEDDSQRLGCYFCNDIIAATNSTRDRTLDQQCTVTRPGLSFIAAALSVEVMVALLHSKHGSRHPAPPTTSDSAHEDRDDEEDEEAVIPHQIRGSLTGFTQFLPQTPAFQSCTACSLPIVKEYRESGVRFVRAACEDSKVLERVSGVAQLLSEVDLDDCVESDEDF